MSVVVRLPEELVESTRRIAALQGRQVADVLMEAWDRYLEAHREDLASDFEHAAQLLRAGDVESLTDFASRGVGERAEAAAGAARK